MARNGRVLLSTFADSMRTVVLTPGNEQRSRDRTRDKQRGIHLPRVRRMLLRRAASRCINVSCGRSSHLATRCLR